MVISPELKYAFVSTVKGGTNSIYQILTEHYQGQRYGEFHCQDVSEIPEAWCLFTTCRNPYSRAVSIWWSTCMRGKDRYYFRQMCPNPDSFEVFAEWAALMQSQLHRMSEPQQQLLMTQSERHGEIDFDLYLKTENLLSGFLQLPFLDSELPEFPVLNPTRNQRDTVAEYMTGRAIRAVQNWMQPDFEKYGYSLDFQGETPIETSAA
ncbi:MAG: hypothetical protein JKY95_09545 [Planctomycetaceae bacterium]|nr:hypothetical protein [Planctomycetaceae bacterium]